MDDLDDFTDRAAESARATSDAFEQAGERISAALERAARSGEVSFNRLAESIVQDLARTAITDLIVDPLYKAIGGLGGAGGQGGSPQSGPVNLTMNVSGVSDASGFERSQNQMAAALSRAARSGGRYG